MDTTRSWLESWHLGRSPEGTRALAGLAALEPARAEEVLAGGDAIAAISVTLAHRYFVAAVTLQSAAPQRYPWWSGLVVGAAQREGGGRALSQALLDLDAAALARLPIHVASAWSACVVRIADEHSVRLAAAYARGVGGALVAAVGRGPELERLPRVWADAVAHVARNAAWRGELLGTHLAESARELFAALEPAAVSLWAELVVRVGSAGKNPRPPDFPMTALGVDRSLHEPLLRVAVTAAVPSPQLAPELLHRACEAIAVLEPAVATQLLAGLAAVPVSSELISALALVPAVVHDAAGHGSHSAIGRAAEIAQAAPEVVPAFLRSMGRALDEGGRVGFDAWIALGLELARGNRAAGLAHFRLETRTSHKVLTEHSAAVTFEELDGTIHRYLRMLARRSLHAVAGPGVWLVPPLDAVRRETVRLPERVELFRTAEDNQSFLLLGAAHAAARWQYGTFEFSRREYRSRGLPEDGLDDTGSDDGLTAFLESFPNPLLAVGLFTLLDGIRIESRLVEELPGLSADLARLGEAYAADSSHQAGERGAEELVETLFLITVGKVAPHALPARLRRHATLLRDVCATLARPAADVYDSASITARLYWTLVYANARAADIDEDFAGVIEFGGATAIDPLEHLDGGAPPAQPGSEGPASEVAGPEDPAPQALRIDLEGAGEQDAAGGIPLTPEEIKALLESGADLQISLGPDGDAASLGLYVTDLLGKLPRDLKQQLEEAVASGDPALVRAWLAAQRAGRFFHYDEWDHRVRDYRRRWCRLAEVEIDGDGGSFFHSAMSHWKDIVDELRREFRMMRPEQFRKVRGMQHGDDFDLNALVDAHVDRRRRKNPPERLYLARRREERDVATLFLIDMSASTDEPLAASDDASRANDAGSPRRVIDVTKETLALMASVLDGIGDAYALYGFSGHGRANVEFYRIKSFSDPFGNDVKSRLGGIEPKRSTRMGAALRHAGTKIRAVSAKARHLILLSDGFPQDYDYGEDRTSNLYGLRDTMVALQELEAQGVRTFCITIDPAGHDYLGEMCPETRYAVIDDVADLPVELPKIYRTVTRL